MQPARHNSHGAQARSRGGTAVRRQGKGAGGACSRRATTATVPKLGPAGEQLCAGRGKGLVVHAAGASQQPRCPS
eukprot:XP_001691174.1 predicted protein [Chlamydomonas reinhardtii]